MKIEYIHRFNYNDEHDFVKIQNDLKGKIELKNRIEENGINICAGVDLAYWEKDGETYGACSIIVLNYKTKEVIEKVYSHGKITVPYIAGFLAFREIPLIIEAAEKLNLEPDVFLFDGNGYLHYNHMGIATHASLFLNKPTIGVAKSYLKIDGVDYIMPENEKGSYKDILINEEVYGRVVRTRKDVKPIFISCGNYIDLETSNKIVMELVNKDSRLPIPVRLADLETHVLRETLN
ncbi:endonuclease V [Tepidibacter aestuarii]|uniref:endonuclease V n=1 Tax=Tepidibacter aestuarii TaxID=2925782 RepID=UPI0020BE498D|nr:endonuclease V [Tepidibacter aestuarii]CAH2214823.1 endonuclease V (excision repair of deaminated bases) [Tepidibacter aestuarii]